MGISPPQKRKLMKILLFLQLVSAATAVKLMFVLSSIHSTSCDTSICTMDATLSDAECSSDALSSCEVLGKNKVFCKFLFSKVDGTILDSECEEKEMEKRRWSQNDFFYHPI